MDDDPRVRNEERVLRQLVHSITDYAIYLLDQEGFVVTWNAGAERIKGYSREEIVGAHFSRFFTEEDKVRGLPRRALETARREGRFESQGWRVRSDGSRFLALAVLDVVKDDRGEVIGFAKIVRDLTEQHAAQQALLDSERRFRLLVEGVIDYAIYMLDPSGVVTNWNAGAERIKGYSAEEIVGRHFSVFFPPEDRKAGVPMRNLQIALREGRYEAEARRVRKDGSEFWANVVLDPIRDSNGDLVGFAKVTRDITERRAAQHALRESERQFSLLIAGVTDYAIYMLDPSGVITSWNAGARNIKGYEANEAIGRHFSMFYTEADRRAGLPGRTLDTALKKGKFEAEGWRVRKDGTLFFAHVVIDSIRDEDGQLVGFAKITRDISERKQAETALAAAQAQLAQAHKMEALGQLTGGVAHDFNNLLMIVSGQAQLLKRKLKDNPEAVRALEAIQTASKRGSDLTRQLLAFARRQPNNPELVEFKERIEPLRTMLANTIPENIRLSISGAADVWPVWADLGELDLALVNLILNARDALPEGGDITVLAENLRVAPGVLRDGLAGDFVVLSVVDTGHGIPADILPKIFDPFFTTKSGGKGTGLGLAQVYGFARYSGGDVQVWSEVGKGSRFSLYLPRSMRAPQGKAPREAEVEAPEVTPISVLVVEDNPDVVQVAREFIQQLGYAAAAVPNAEAALETLAAAPDAHQLVLTDIVMPGAMDGIELARKIRERWPDLPVLLMTGYTNAVERAGDDFPTLRKPFEIAELARAISTLISASADPEEAAGNVVRLRKRKAKDSAS